MLNRKGSAYGPQTQAMKNFLLSDEGQKFVGTAEYNAWLESLAPRHRRHIEALIGGEK